MSVRIKRKYKYSSPLLFFIIVLSAFLSTQTYAQLEIGGTPFSFAAKNLDGAPVITMPPIDLDKLLFEDELDAQVKDIPPRFGKGFDANLSLENSGEWYTLSNGDKLWKLSISAPNAYSINFLYDDFWLPEGAKLYIYDENRDFIIGAYTKQNNTESGEFATRPVKGDFVTIEYYEPRNVNYPGRFTLKTIVHGYRNIFFSNEEKGFGSSGECNNNVNCPEGEEWQNDKRSVAMVILASGSRWCSGAMINNERQDLKQYFLTANHCTSSSTASWVFMFNYESPDCENVDGPTSYTVLGADLLASNSESDFALLEINETIPDSFHIFWAGWNRLDIAPSSSVGIHHPSGDIKKISFDYDPAVSNKYLGNSGLEDSHWEILQWDDGTTEGGSSGSPLFDPLHRIVGQLHGGWASCTNLSEDYYGKFSMSWDRGATPDSRLKDWLDPDDTGIEVLNGWDPTLADPDTIPPSTINDLLATEVRSNSMMLTWSAPIDTSIFGIVNYIIKMSMTPIDEANFENAVTLFFHDTPKNPGETENFEVTNLDFNQTYYFAIKSKDYWNNVSEISNVINETTLGLPEANVDPTSFSFTDVTPGTNWTSDIVISNISANPSTLDYAAIIENNTFPNGSIKIKLSKDYKNEEKIVSKTSGKNIISGSGGPDNFGYRWKDSDQANGPDYLWEEISTTGTTVSFVGFGTSGISRLLDIGFIFEYYGVTQSQFVVSSNGFISFDLLFNEHSENALIPMTDIPNNIIAPFWDHLDGSQQGKVYYKTDDDKLIVQYSDWETSIGSGFNTFQIVLHADGKIYFYYKEIAGPTTGVSVGIENSTGTDGLSVAYNSDYPLRDEFSIVFYSRQDEWLFINDPGAGTIFNGDNATVQIEFITDQLDEDDYSADLIIATSDPNHEQFIVPISLNVVTSVSDENRSLPDKYYLSQNFPNPFNPSTDINYALPFESYVSLEIFDLLGQKIKSLVNDIIPSGYHNVEWNANGFPSGIYFIKIEAVAATGKESFIDFKKMIYLK